MRGLYCFFVVWFLSCCAAGVTNAQEQTINDATGRQAFFETFFPSPDTKTLTGTDASYVVVNINDTITIASGEADSVDNKDMAANNTTANEGTSETNIANVPNHGTMEIPDAYYNKENDAVIDKYAEMIILDPDDVKNFPLYKFIDQWYGVRYKWGGTGPNGIDCSAFSQKLYGKIYSVNILRTARQQHRTCEKVGDIDEATEGDLVFFRIHHIRISHVGVYLANGYFVHASRSHGVVISSLNDHYWRSRYAGCGRVAKQDRAATESDFIQ